MIHEHDSIEKGIDRYNKSVLVVFAIVPGFRRSSFSGCCLGISPNLSIYASWDS